MRNMAEVDARPLKLRYNLTVIKKAVTYKLGDMFLPELNMAY